MKDKNCPNCGAVIEVDKNKCPYCGTSYFDFANIPLNEPFYLRIKTNDGKMFTQKVFLSNMSATHNYGYCETTIQHPYQGVAPVCAPKCLTTFELTFESAIE